MARVIASLDDRAAMMDLFSDVTRMPFPGGAQTADWAHAFEDAGRPELAREIFENALTALHKRDSQQPELMKAWIEFLTRRHDFAAAEVALMKHAWLIVADAAPLVFALYRDWDKLDSLDAELPKLYLPSGVEKEVRFLAEQHRAGRVPGPKAANP